VRTDKGGELDTDGNHAPDGILGPYRQKEGSFYTIKEIWSPIHVGLKNLPEDFSGRIDIENRYGFTNLNKCRFEWKLIEFPNPLDDKAESRRAGIIDSGSVAAPNVEPGGDGALELHLPENWAQASALHLTARDTSGEEVWTWSWATARDCARCHQYFEQKSKQDADIAVVETGLNLVVKIDKLNLWFDKKSGRLAGVEKDGTRISFGEGPRLITGDSKLLELTHRRDGNDVFVETKYEGGLNYARWKIYPSGWIRLDYEYELEGQFDLMGVTFDYPEGMMEKMKWVGRGPYRVWKNRTKGGRLDIWTNDYKDHTPGLTWDLPEFRGYYADWQWAVFETREGKIRVLNTNDDIFLGVYTPKNGPDPARTKLDLPQTGISLLHGIPAIGTKFKKAEEFGPESQKNIASGKYKNAVYFYFEAKR